MRVLLIHNTLWAHYKSVLFQQLAKAAKQASIDFHVIQIALTEKQRSGLGSPDNLLTDYPHEVLFNGPLEGINIFQRSWRLLKRGWAYNPDIVTITGYYDPAQVLLALVLKLRGCRIIVQNESTTADQARNSWRERIKTWFLTSCDGFFCFGTKAADYLKRLGVDKEKIFVKNNAVVDNDRLRSVFDGELSQRVAKQHKLNLKPHNFIFVGRFIPLKNLLLLLETLAEAIRRNPSANDWGLLLVGEGEQKDELQALIKKLDLTDRVQFMGGHPWYRVPEYLALADVLVLPSRSEAWGLVVNEAMACSMPVIVSDRCGCAVDLVRQGQNGFVFEVDKPEGLVRSLEAFMTKKASVREMGEVSRQLIASFSPEAVAREMVRGFVKLNGS